MERGIGKNTALGVVEGSPYAHGRLLLLPLFKLRNQRRVVLNRHVSSR